MSILNNPSRLNGFIVSNGYSVSDGNGASAYIIFKKLEKKVTAYMVELEETYSDDKYYKGLDAIGKAKLQNAIKRMLEKAKYLVVKRLDAISDIGRLQEFMEEDIDKVVDKVIMGSITSKIEKILQ